jgi:UDP-glucose 4-epimerase
MKILITSAGRLGTLLYHALKHEHELAVLRRRPDPTFGDACVVGDVSKYDDVSRAMEGCQVVFHTAVRNNTDVEVKSYEQFLASNVDGSFNVFLAALRLGVPRVVHSSTCMVCGIGVPLEDKTRARRVDDAVARRCGDIYGLTKILGEMTADYFRDTHDMSIISLRYGWLALPELYRDPKMIYNTLSFCFHEQDALAANLLVMNQQTTGNYLIGAPSRFTDADAADLIAEPQAALARHYPDELAYLLSIGMTPTPIASWLDCSGAMRDLGYKPQFDFPRFVQLHREGAF